MVGEPGQVSASALIGATVVAAFLFFRLMRFSRASVLGQEFKLGSMWISGFLFVGLAALVIALQPPHGPEWLWLALGLLLGVPVRWWRGKMIELKVNPVTGALTARTSMFTAVFLVGLIALRYGLRFVLMSDGSPVHLSVKVATITLLAFALGLVVAQRVEMTLRAIQLSASAARTAAFQAPSMVIAPSSEAPPPAAASAPLRAGLSNAQLVLVGAAVFIVVVILGLAVYR